MKKVLLTEEVGQQNLCDIPTLAHPLSIEKRLSLSNCLQTPKVSLPQVSPKLGWETEEGLGHLLLPEPPDLLPLEDPELEVLPPRPPPLPLLLLLLPCFW